MYSTIKQAILCTALTFCCALALNAQDSDITLDEESKSKMSLGKNNGSFIGFGFVVGPNEFSGANINYGNSGDFIYGGRRLHKLGIQEFFKLGTSFYYRYSDYRLEQDSQKTFPTSNLFDKEKIAMHFVGFDAFMSIRFDKKLNKKHGTKLDLGGYIDWAFNKQHKTIAKIEDPINPPYAKKIVTVNKKLDYIENFHYGLLARFTFKQVSIYGNYRINNIFVEKYNFKDVPKFMIGIQFGV